MNFPKRVITLQRTVKRNTQALETQTDHIVQRGLGGNRGQGWTYKKGKKLVDDSGDQTIIRYAITFQKKSGQQAVEEKQWKSILQFMVDAGRNTKYQPNNWEVFEGRGSNPAINSDVAVTPTAEEKSGINKKEFSYGDLNIDPGNYFDHIFDRDFQIYRICQVLRVAMQTDMNEREHGVLWGPPGCGKTTLMQAMSQMVGPENVWSIDATSSTGAGALRQLLERRNTIPPIVYIEEIEKRDQKELQWLLSATDDRGEVRKLNFFVNDVRSVRFVTFCTVNNMELFREKCEGALSSRFCEVYCPPPNRETIGKILKARMDLKLGELGNDDWIEPCLEFCWDDLCLTDPREFIRVLMTGQADLLTKDCQLSYLATMDPNKFWELDLPNKLADHDYFQKLKEDPYYEYIERAKPNG